MDEDKSNSANDFKKHEGKQENIDFVVLVVFAYAVGNQQNNYAVKDAQQHVQKLDLFNYHSSVLV